MPSMLDQLKAMTTVVADTGDIDAVRRLQPIDCTTNPSIILKAIAAPEFKDAFLEAIDWGARSSGSIEARVAAVADRLAVSVGAALAEIVPGRVSTEVDADLSFDMVASVARAEKIIEDYAQRGIDRERILVKLASTWEGIRAAQELQQKGIDCNLTLLFSKAQAIACANAGVFLISPFVGRIYDWHVKATGETFAPEEDPGVLSVQGIYNYYKTNDIPTVVMGASFRSIGQITALAGCDRLTIAPNLLEELSQNDSLLQRKLTSENSTPEPKVKMDEKHFRWEMNQDAMATEMLSAGIRGFAVDLGKLRTIVRRQIS